MKTNLLLLTWSCSATHLWQRRFAGDPAVVGRKVTRGDEPFTIVGVMPREFDFPQGASVWVPVGPELDAVRRRDSMAPDAFRGLGVLYVVGRLKDGVSRDAARTDLAGISHRLSLADGFSTVGWSARLVPLVDHHLGASTRQALEALAVASGLVLVLACANVAVLLLVQASSRRTDLAVRKAMGASAGRLALHQLAESALVALAGGVLGTLLARGAVRAVVAFGPSESAGPPGRECRQPGARLRPPRSPPWPRSWWPWPRRGSSPGSRSRRS